MTPKEKAWLKLCILGLLILLFPWWTWIFIIWLGGAWIGVDGVDSLFGNDDNSPPLNYHWSRRASNKKPLVRDPSRNDL